MHQRTAQQPIPQQIQRSVTVEHVPPRDYGPDSEFARRLVERGAEIAKRYWQADRMADDPAYARQVKRQQFLNRVRQIGQEVVAYAAVIGTLVVASDFYDREMHANAQEGRPQVISLGGPHPAIPAAVHRHTAAQVRILNRQERTADGQGLLESYGVRLRPDVYIAPRAIVAPGGEDPHCNDIFIAGQAGIRPARPQATIEPGGLAIIAAGKPESDSSQPVMPVADGPFPAKRGETAFISLAGGGPEAANPVQPAVILNSRNAHNIQAIMSLEGLAPAQTGNRTEGEPPEDLLPPIIGAPVLNAQGDMTAMVTGGEVADEAELLKKTGIRTLLRSPFVVVQLSEVSAAQVAADSTVARPVHC